MAAGRPAAEHSQKEKGPLAGKRPKSREETPKEGSGDANRVRIAALQQYVVRRTKKQELWCPNFPHGARWREADQ
jgi:hypothetical protein